MAARPSGPELRGADRSDRWDRDRLFYEQDREIRDRGGRFEEDRRSRFEEDESYYRRAPAPARESSERPRRRFVDEDDVVVRERSEVKYRDGPDFLRRRPSPPDSEIDRRIFYKREQERRRSPSPPRPRRPGQMVRRQSSLDTFDRKPTRYHEREYSPPRRGGDYRVPPYQPIPLPRSKALPPPRVYAERDFYEEIEVADEHRHRHGEDDFHGHPEKIHEKEIVHTRRRRSVSRSSRRRHRSRSQSSSSSSSSGGTSLTATTRTTRTTNEYPKKGKTRIPSRLVSKRALIDLGYPFVEDGNVVIVQKALGQQNIDDLLKLSEDYKKSELEVMAARSSAGDVVEERIVEERHTEYVNVAPPHNQVEVTQARHEHIELTQQHHHHPSGAHIVTAEPPVVALPPPVPVAPQPAAQYVPQAAVQYAPQPTAVQYAPEPTVQFARTAMVREASPARSYTTTTTSTSTTGTVTGPVIVDAYPAEHYHHHHQPHYSQELVPVTSGHEIVLPRRSRSRHHSRHGSRDLVRAERLSTGELVLYEEEVEHVAPTRGGVRIEKDKRGRMSISVPRNR